jgi:hypothetical protein
VLQKCRVVETESGWDMGLAQRGVAVVYAGAEWSKCNGKLLFRAFQKAEPFVKPVNVMLKAANNNFQDHCYDCLTMKMIEGSWTSPNNETSFVIKRLENVL